MEDDRSEKKTSPETEQGREALIKRCMSNIYINSTERIRRVNCRWGKKG
jgi:hypothetical protein